MNIGKLTVVAATSAVSLLACNASTLIGMVPDGSAPDAPAQSDGGPVLVGDAGHSCTAPDFQNDVPYTLPAGVAGTWTGYFQGGSPLQTSDVVKLSLQPRADGTGEIHVTMGTAAPPPPATSATDYYPPGVSPAMPSSFPTVLDGVAYLAHAVTWQGTRLKFVVPGAQPYESWCALQSSYYVPDRAEYNCIPGFGGTSSPGPMDAGSVCSAYDDSGKTMIPVACAQLAMCNGYYCSCDSCGCSASALVSGDFDVTFDGDVVTGVGIGHNVRLTRDAP